MSRNKNYIDDNESFDRYFDLGDDEIPDTGDDSDFDDDMWEEILFENIQNNLPKWNRDKLFPKINDEENDDNGRNHIRKNHTILGRLPDLLDVHSDTAREILGRKDFETKRQSFINKIKTKKPLTKIEDELLRFLVSLDKKDYFPATMSMEKIVNYIGEAYKNAKKVSKRQISTLPGDKWWMYGTTTESIRYQGVTDDGTVIEFWYNFTRKEIETAYPLTKNPKRIVKKKGN